KSFRSSNTANLSEIRTSCRPSSIVLTEKDNAEWGNVVIKHLWPYTDCLIKIFFKQTIEPAIENVLKGFKSNNFGFKTNGYEFGFNIPYFTFKINESQFALNGFKFTNISLGDSPPRISNVQVNEDSSRDEIILDMDVTYDGNGQLEVSLSALMAGIQNIKLMGRLRMVLKPLMCKCPPFGGLQIYFLRNPILYFDVAGLASVPGLSSILSSIINNQIKNRLVLPNSLAFKFSHDIDVISLKYPMPIGIIRIHVKGAKKIKKSDLFGSSDPFCCIHLGSQMFKTKTIIKNLNPIWNYSCEFYAMVSRGQEVEFEVWDFDVTNHDFLGRASIDVSEILQNGSLDKQIPLFDGKGKKLEGEIHIEALWLSLTSKIPFLNKDEFKMKHSAMLRVWLHSAKCFASTKSLPNPFVRLSLGNIAKYSAVLVGTKSPLFEEGFNFMINSPETEPPLFLELWDQNTNKIQDKLSIEICSLLEKDNMEIDQEFHCNGTPIGTVAIKLNIALKFFKPPLTESPIVECNNKRQILELRSSTECGKIRLTLQYMNNSMFITIHEMQNLPLEEDGDKPNCYVKIYLLPDRSRNFKRKTSVVKDSCNPVYNSEFNYHITKRELETKTLEISVINKKGFGHLHKSSVIGQIHIGCISLNGDENMKWYLLQFNPLLILSQWQHDTEACSDNSMLHLQQQHDTEAWSDNSLLQQQHDTEACSDNSRLRS
ncbi:unnamed protein product, partial [Meganyctiphanes norvegica]